MTGTMTRGAGPAERAHHGSSSGTAIARPPQVRAEQLGMLAKAA